MNFARSGMIVFLSRVLSAVITFAALSIFTKALGVNLMGIFFLFSGLLSLLAIPADIGIDDAVEKRISEGTRQERYLTTGFIMKSLITGIVAVAVLIFAERVNNYIGADIAEFLAVAILLHAGANLFIRVLSGELRVGIAAIVRLFINLTFITIALVLVFVFNIGIISLIIAQVCGFIVALTFGFLIRDTEFGFPDFELAQSLFSYAKFASVSRIGGLAYNWVDVLLIGYFLSNIAVSQYELAWRVTMLPMLVSQTINRIVFPQISAWFEEDNFDAISTVIRNGAAVVLLVTLPAFVGVMVIGEEILVYLFRPEVGTAAIVLSILMGEKIFQSIQTVFYSALNGIDRPDIGAILAVFAIGLNVILNITLIPIYGILGAAVATSISFVINMAMTYHYLSKIVNIVIPFREIGIGLFCSIAMGLILILAEQIIIINSLLRTGLFVVLGGVVYAALVLFFPPTRKQTMDTIDQVW